MTRLQRKYDTFCSVGTADSADEFDYKRLYRASEDFFMELLASDSDDIYSLLKEVNARDILEMPFFMRTITFRILVSMNPTNAKMITDAIQDLSLFRNDYEATSQYYRELINDTGKV